MKVSELTREEKIALIKKLSTGEVSVVNGEIVEKSVILIQKDGQYFLNGTLVDKNELDKRVESMIILPDNGRDDNLSDL